MKIGNCISCKYAVDVKIEPNVDPYSPGLWIVRVKCGRGLVKRWHGGKHMCGRWEGAEDKE